MNKEKLIEVPEEIYNDIERYEKGVFYAKASTIWAILDNMQNGSYQTSTDEWLRNHDTELIDAVLYGCKPMKKRWVVKMKNAFFADFAKSFLGDERKEEWGLADFNTIVKEELAKAYKFTDKAKAEAVATLVGGKVEEL